MDPTSRAAAAAPAGSSGKRKQVAWADAQQTRELQVDGARGCARDPSDPSRATAWKSVEPRESKHTAWKSVDTRRAHDAWLAELSLSDTMEEEEEEGEAADPVPEGGEEREVAEGAAAEEQQGRGVAEAGPRGRGAGAAASTQAQRQAAAAERQRANEAAAAVLPKVRQKRELAWEPGQEPWRKLLVFNCQVHQCLRKHAQYEIRATEVVDRTYREAGGVNADGRKMSRRPDQRTLQWMIRDGLCVNQHLYAGHTPGVPIGKMVYSRAEMHTIGAHKGALNGISSWREGECGPGVPSFATSVVVSGNYADDGDNGEELVYTGQGGHDLLGNKRQRDHQALERGNKALLGNIRLGIPVRVTRKVDDEYSKYGHGYQYDGLYDVRSYWSKKGQDGYRIFQFKLVRRPGQGPLLSERVEFGGKSAPRKLAAVARNGLVDPDISGGLEALPIPAVDETNLHACEAAPAGDLPPCTPLERVPAEGELRGGAIRGISEARLAQASGPPFPSWTRAGSRAAGRQGSARGGGACGARKCARRWERRRRPRLEIFSHDVPSPASCMRAMRPHATMRTRPSPHTRMQLRAARHRPTVEYVTSLVQGPGVAPAPRAVVPPQNKYRKDPHLYIKELNKGVLPYMGVSSGKGKGSKGPVPTLTRSPVPVAATQRGLRYRLEVFKTPLGTGWGLRSWDVISAFTYVCDYMGEVFKAEEFAKAGEAHLEFIRGGVMDRGAEYCYEMALRPIPAEDADVQRDWADHVGSNRPPAQLLVDAARKRSAGAFINHSCSPNCFIQPVLRGTLDKSLDYGEHYVQHLAEQGCCRCGTEDCVSKQRPAVARPAAAGPAAAQRGGPGGR
eukprot:scaffold9.g3133.t1